MIEVRIPAHSTREDGMATVEFVGVVIALLIPIIYIITAVSAVQAAQFSADAAAYEAARAYTLSRSQGQGREHAALIAQQIFADQGFTSAPTIAASCDRGDSLTPGGIVSVTVSYEVPLPLITQFMPVSIPVSSQSSSVVGVYVYRGEA